MGHRVNEFTVFVRHFIKYVLYVREVLVGLLVLLAGGGFLISYIEKLPLTDGLYFAFITGLTIGYGDLVPHTPLGRVIAVTIGMIGMIFTGVTVAAATRALADASKFQSQ